MSSAALKTTDTLPLNAHLARAESVAGYLDFVREARQQLSEFAVGQDAAEVRAIRQPLEQHYVDESGKPAMYQHCESALYDDASNLVTLWQSFDTYDREDLHRYQRLTELELEGLRGDRHPRSVFDRSPFGVAALVVGTVTIWMTVFQTYSGENLTPLLEAVRFNSIAGVIWIVGMFIALWYILKTHRNNKQVAFLATLSRALRLYLDE